MKPGDTIIYANGGRFNLDHWLRVLKARIHATLNADWKP